MSKFAISMIKVRRKEEEEKKAKVSFFVL